MILHRRTGHPVTDGCGQEIHTLIKGKFRHICTCRKNAVYVCIDLRVYFVCYNCGVMPLAVVKNTVRNANSSRAEFDNKLTCRGNAHIYHIEVGIGSAESAFKLGCQQILVEIAFGIEIYLNGFGVFGDGGNGFIIGLFEGRKINTNAVCQLLVVIVINKVINVAVCSVLCGSHAHKFKIEKGFAASGNACLNIVGKIQRFFGNNNLTLKAIRYFLTIACGGSVNNGAILPNEFESAVKIIAGISGSRGCFNRIRHSDIALIRTEHVGINHIGCIKIKGKCFVGFIPGSNRKLGGSTSGTITGFIKLKLAVFYGNVGACAPGNAVAPSAKATICRAEILNNNGLVVGLFALLLHPTDIVNNKLIANSIVFAIGFKAYVRSVNIIVSVFMKIPNGVITAELLYGIGCPNIEGNNDCTRLTCIAPNVAVIGCPSAAACGKNFGGGIGVFGGCIGDINKGFAGNTISNCAGAAAGGKINFGFEGNLRTGFNRGYTRKINVKLQSNSFT